MRNIKYIAIHCTATSPNATVQSIQNYWRKTLKWKSPGYHYLIEASGKINQLLSEDLVSNGVAGYNSVSVHVSYIGGIDSHGKAKDTRTSEQQHAMLLLVKQLKKKYPTAIIQGHRDFPNVRKECPSFNVKTWLAEVGI